MTTITSNDNHIKSIIQKNIVLIIENNGYTHPDLEIIYTEGNISINSNIDKNPNDDAMLSRLIIRAQLKKREDIYLPHLEQTIPEMSLKFHEVDLPSLEETT